MNRTEWNENLHTEILKSGFSVGIFKTDIQYDYCIETCGLLERLQEITVIIIICSGQLRQVH